jgi:hypothetical protein
VRSPFCNAKRNSTKLSLTSSKSSVFISDAAEDKIRGVAVMFASPIIAIKLTGILSIYILVY